MTGVWNRVLTSVEILDLWHRTHTLPRAPWKRTEPKGSFASRKLLRYDVPIGSAYFDITAKTIQIFNGMTWVTP